MSLLKTTIAFLLVTAFSICFLEWREAKRDRAAFRWRAHYSLQASALASISKAAAIYSSKTYDLLRLNYRGPDQDLSFEAWKAKSELLFEQWSDSEFDALKSAIIDARIWFSPKDLALMNPHMQRLYSVSEGSEGTEFSKRIRKLNTELWNSVNKGEALGSRQADWEQFENQWRADFKECVQTLITVGKQCMKASQPEH